MILPDVNVLIYASREEFKEHASCRQWLQTVINGDQAFGISELVLSGFVRIVTNNRIMNPATPLEIAFKFADTLRSASNCVLVSPGPRHWEIFERLCREANVKGPLVTDAYFAALAIESGSEWITTDRDYSRFSGLRWRHPLES